MRFSFLYLFSLFLFTQPNLIAQTSQRTTTTFEFPREETMFIYSGEIPYTNQPPFFSYFLEWSGGPLQFSARFSQDRSNWTSWQVLKRDAHNTDKGITELQFGRPEFRYFEISVNSKQAQTQAATLHFYHPGITISSTQEVEVSSESSPFACPCPLPELESREDWCPSGDCPEQASPAATTVTHLIVHHSAGTNSASDWAAIVRSIWDFHVNGNNWDDIGYNYLVDPNGVIYEGRGNNIRGAHFCGTNTGTMGVCVMGNFTDIEPTGEAITALERLLAWKICDIDADPFEESYHASSNRTLHRISGHQDGCATACPGDSFYPLLPTVREGTNNQILANCSGLSSPINLMASQVNETTYSLNWTHNSPEESGFQLERSLDNGDHFELRADLPADVLNFMEDELEPNQIYLYRIRAYNETDTSLYSNIVEINTALVGVVQPSLPASALKLSPNPAKDLLQLQLNGPWSGRLNIRLSDIRQRLLLAEESKKHNDHWQGQLNIGNLPPGVYFLNLEIDGHQGAWKVVKQ